MMSQTLESMTTRSALITRLLASGGVLGPLIFVVAFTVAGILRPGYSPVHQAISDLGVGSHPWLLNVPAVVMGVLLIACSAGLLRALGPALGDPWRWVCSGLLALVGLGYAWVGIFTEAPSTLTLHWVVGMPLVGIGSIGGFLVTGLRLRRLESWRGLGTYSVASSASTFGLMAFMFGTWTMGFGGLTERAFVVEILAWYIVVGWRMVGIGAGVGHGRALN